MHFRPMNCTFRHTLGMGDNFYGSERGQNIVSSQRKTQCWNFSKDVAILTKRAFVLYIE